MGNSSLIMLSSLHKMRAVVAPAARLAMPRAAVCTKPSPAGDKKDDELPTEFPYRQSSSVTNKTQQSVRDGVVIDRKQRSMFSTQAAPPAGDKKDDELPTEFPYHQSSSVTNKTQQRVRDGVVIDRKQCSMFSTQA